MLVQRFAMIGAAVLWSAAAVAQTGTAPPGKGHPSKPVTSRGMPVPVQADRPVSASRTSGMNPQQKRQDRPAADRKSDKLRK